MFISCSDALGGDVVLEPYLITLKEDAVAYTGFRHAGTELIYMLSGKVVYRHGDQSYPLDPGDSRCSIPRPCTAPRRCSNGQRPISRSSCTGDPVPVNAFQGNFFLQLTL